MGVGGVERDMVLGDGVPFVIQDAVVGKAIVVCRRCQSWGMCSRIWRVLDFDAYGRTLS